MKSREPEVVALDKFLTGDYIQIVHTINALTIKYCGATQIYLNEAGVIIIQLRVVAQRCSSGQGATITVERCLDLSNYENFEYG